jgi:RNA-directed DNA polymerase
MSLRSRIAQELFLSEQFVLVVTRTASRRYKEYSIPKRSGGHRTILHPARELKALQRWLLSNVVNHWPVHGAASAYRQGRSIIENVSPHRLHPYILKLDFDTFFPSISSDDVRAFLDAGPAAAMKWERGDIWTFLSLVCRHDQLAIGVPTSPALSNALCFDLDSRLSTWASEHGITYTRYADDITLSCEVPNRLGGAVSFVEDTLAKLQIPRRLMLRKDKTRHLSRKRRRVVTGLVLTPDGQISLGRRVKRRLRSLIHSYDGLSVPARRSLAGMLSYAISIEPDLLNRLTIKFGPTLVKQALLPPAPHGSGDNT